MISEIVDDKIIYCCGWCKHKYINYDEFIQHSLKCRNGSKQVTLIDLD